MNKNGKKYIQNVSSWYTSSFLLHKKENPMNSKKYLSALLLTLTLASSQALKAEDDYGYDSYANYSLGGIVDSALEAPRDVVDSATDIAEEPVDAVLGDEEIVEEEPLEDSSYDDIEDNELPLEDMDYVPGTNPAFVSDGNVNYVPGNNPSFVSDKDVSYASQKYSYTTYGALDADNIDSDYNAELE
jgi:hypothetical protein